MKDQNKPGDWDYLICRWSRILVIGIILLILVIGGIVIGLGISLHKWVNN